MRLDTIILLLLLGVAIILLANCTKKQIVESHKQIERLIDEELNVVCYASDSALSCVNLR